MVHITGVLE